uniref:transmembrane protein 107 like isoform X4 n=1 Tax=Pristiophorus japonicus TaxID=55135 RepID=UPI00398ECAD2
MPMPSSLVPSRFLTLVAHLLIVINIFWSRESSVLACLPPTYTSRQYQSRDTEMIVALSVTLGMFLIELLGFLSGVSMFNSTQNLICILQTVTHNLELIPEMARTSAFPACSEIVIMIAVFGLKKKPL